MANKVIARAQGSLLGAIVGDAAALPLHWIYNEEAALKEIKEACEESKTNDFSFVKEMKSPFYTLPSGYNSVYGDTTLTSVISICRKKSLDIKDWKLSMTEMFGKHNDADSSLYQASKILRTEIGQCVEKSKAIMTKLGLSGANDEGMRFFPIRGPWISHTVYEYLEHGNSVETNDPESFCILLPYLCYLAINDCENKNGFPKKELSAFVNELIKSEDTSYRALLLCELIWNIIFFSSDKEKGERFNVRQWIDNKSKEISKENDKVSKELSGVLAAFDKNGIKEEEEENKDNKDKNVIDTASGKAHIKTVGELGKACPYPGSFQSVLHNILIVEALKQYDYKQTVLREIAANGDTCSRSLMTGAIIGSMVGADGIPKEWIAKANNAKTVETFNNEIGAKK